MNHNRLLSLIDLHQTKLLFAVAALLLFAGLGNSGIYILDEARNAQAAREMMDQHEWLIPTFNGELRPHKPPLHYYFMQLAYRTMGVNAGSARFFSAVFGWLTLSVTWFFCKRYVNISTANWSVIILLLSTHFLFEFRLAVPDPYLIFFITTGIFCFYAYATENKLSWLVGSAIAAGLATLAKGPVALLLPGITIFWWLLLQKKYELLFSWKIILYVLLVAIISLPWFIAIHYATNGIFTKEFFFQHNLSRFGDAMEGHGGLFIIVPFFVLLGLLPLSIFIGEVVKKWRSYKAHPLLLLCMQTTIVFVVFFSISGTKLPNYPMPVYPFVALLSGYWISRQTKEMAAKQYPFVVLLILTVLLTTAAFIGLVIEPATGPFTGWTTIFLVPVATALTGWLYLKRLGFKKSLFIVAGGYLLFNFLFLVLAYPAIYRNNPVAKTQHLLRKHEQVYAYKTYNPAYNFYLNKPIKVLDTAEELGALLQQPGIIKIISREAYLSELRQFPLKLIATERDLFETATTIILRSGK